MKRFRIATDWGYKNTSISEWWFDSMDSVREFLLRDETGSKIPCLDLYEYEDTEIVETHHYQRIYVD